MSPSKYDGMKVLVETTSRSPQQCARCGRSIPAGELHFREKLTNSRIHFIGKRFCLGCHGQELTDIAGFRFWSE